MASDELLEDDSENFLQLKSPLDFADKDLEYLMATEFIAPRKESFNDRSQCLQLLCEERKTEEDQMSLANLEKSKKWNGHKALALHLKVILADQIPETPIVPTWRDVEMAHADQERTGFL